LIERLETCLDELGDVEVRLMTQANYPFENTIAGVTTGAEINEDADDDPDADSDEVSNDDVVYIVEGQQLGYGTKRAWQVAC
jgi:hypothetical protein